MRIRVHGGITESRDARAARLKDIKQFLEQLPPLASYQSVRTKLGQEKFRTKTTLEDEYSGFYFPRGLAGQVDLPPKGVDALFFSSRKSSGNAVLRLSYEWGGLAFDAQGRLLGWQVEAPPDPGPHGRETHFTLDSLRIDKK